ncbi:MAG: hypothetical protein E6I79_03665 [Chloroflexi bacterium]|nr:MAG: hypothetical protein E6I79_03665 [Chloroflexota bacterium]
MQRFGYTNLPTPGVAYWFFRSLADDEEMENQRKNRKRLQEPLMREPPVSKLAPSAGLWRN